MNYRILLLDVSGNHVGRFQLTSQSLPVVIKHQGRLFLHEYVDSLYEETYREIPAFLIAEIETGVKS